ncbi:NADAR family protein [Pantoea sp. MBD-2R]|uniref:NADAR family protein n=1 Tax=Pantoea sp. MBD-2R TaxID=3141540 RepID=UPI003183DA5A
MSNILFYRVSDDFGFFSNFSKYGFELEGHYWPTVEHYFQSKKFDDEKIKNKIRLMSSPMDAALMGRNRKNPLVNNWELIKDDVMRAAVFEKFFQNHDIRDLLLSTGDVEIVEHTKNDSYWGDGGDGKGKNMLGIIIMEVRGKLRGISY